MSNVLRQFKVILLSVLLLTGFGCKGKAPIAQRSDAVPASDAQVADAPKPDAGPQIPQGWKVYENKEQGVKIAYPGTWYASADTITNPQPADLKRVFFDPEPIQGGLETEPSYLAMLESWSGTVAEVLAKYEPDTQKNITVGGRAMTRFTYGAEFFGNTKPVAYVFTENGKVYLLQRLDGSDTDLEAMLATLEVL